MKSILFVLSLALMFSTGVFASTIQINQVSAVEYCKLLKAEQRAEKAYKKNRSKSLAVKWQQSEMALYDSKAWKEASAIAGDRYFSLKPICGNSVRLFAVIEEKSQP